MELIFNDGNKFEIMDFGEQSPTTFLIHTYVDNLDELRNEVYSSDKSMITIRQANSDDIIFKNYTDITKFSALILEENNYVTIEFSLKDINAELEALREELARLKAQS